MSKKISIIIVAFILIVGVLSLKNISYAAGNETVDETTNENIGEKTEPEIGENAEDNIVIINTEETIEVDEEIEIIFTSSGKVTWKSSNTSIATVDESGKVKGIKAGTATITGTVGQKSETCKITVKEKEVVEEIKWTDASKAKVNLKRQERDKIYYDVILEVTGIERIDKHKYYNFITYSNSKPEIKLNDNGEIDSIKTSNIAKELDNGKLNINKEYSLNGDLYYWLCEEQYNNNTEKYEYKFLIEAKKIERVAQNKLGSRTRGYFFSDSSSIFYYEPKDDNGKYNFNIKIGRITDNSILQSIKNGEAGCLQKLLAYAKSTKTEYAGKIPLGESATITDKFNVIDGAYYYVYMQLDDENGKNYPVEEVSLYQGSVGSAVGKNLYDYLDENFKWNLEETPATPDKTIATGKIPQTGESAVIVITLVITLILGGIAIIKYRRNNI